MSERVRRKNRNKKIRNIVLLVFTLFSISSIYLIYNISLLSGIENVIRMIFMGLIVILILVFLIFSLKKVRKGTLKEIISFIFITLLVAILELVGAIYINKAYSSISKMNKVEATYGTSLIALKDSKIDTVNDLRNRKIGIINDTESIEGYVISQEIVKDNNIDKDDLVEYDDFLSMLNDLYEENVDAIFVSSSYISMFSSFEHFTNIKSDTKVLLSKTKTMTKKENTGNLVNNDSSITKPFTMLVMGIDSTEDNIKNATSFNGDSLILITFNPKTLNSTMVSIPRDTFVPIMCFKNHIQNKITHAAWYGESCMIDTIENFMGINIDYYAKINFKGVVKLVDALGGVEVDVPYNFCEQNSNREWGNNTIYVTKGLQTLNGEEALAFARNRHPNPSMCTRKWTNYYSDDFVRGQNQQAIIKALTNKVKNIRNINKLYEILDLVEKSMDTNLSTNQILSFYNIGKNILEISKTEGDILNFQKLYLSTYGAMIYDEGMKQALSDQIYYKESLKEIVDAMKINLGLKEPTIIKTFSFSVNETYEEEVIGKGDYNESGVSLVPNFTARTKQYAINWGLNNGVDINFKTIESDEAKYDDDQIINQSIPSSSLTSIAKSKGITLTIINKVDSPISGGDSTEKIDCTIEENKDNKSCIVPDFVKGNFREADVNAWKSKLTSDSVTIINLSTTITTNDKSRDGYVCDQADTENKSLYNISSKRISLTYCNYVETTEEDPLNPLMP